MAPKPSIEGPVMAMDDLCLLDLVEIGRRIQARQLSARIIAYYE